MKQQPTATPKSEPAGPSGPSAERESLKRAEKAAARQPGSFKDRENEEKIVEIGRDREDDPIKGLDPDT